ncbi:MAG: hypothetical protein IJ532_01830 [Alphaproteobacteria bacterium]|nr:hypothetical protein [Alphaproteobacteria bacterium]
MKQAEIEAKIIELALIYANQGADSADALKLVEELAKENKDNVSKARLSLNRKIMMNKVTVKQDKKDVKVTIANDTVKEVMSAIETARNKIENTETKENIENTERKSDDLGKSSETAEKNEELHQNPPEMTVANNNTQKKPANAYKQNENNAKLDEIISDINDYIYGKTSRYSVKIVKSAEDKDNALKILNHLKAEFARRPKKDEAKIKRGNLVKLALAVGAKNIADDNVKKTLTDLLRGISKRCQNDFIRFETKKEDFKDNFVVYLSSNKNNEIAEFLHNIYVEHAKGLYDKLDDDFKPKYQKWINDFSDEVEAKAKAAAERKKAEAEKRAKKNQN